MTHFWVRGQTFCSQMSVCYAVGNLYCAFVALLLWDLQLTNIRSYICSVAMGSLFLGPERTFLRAFHCSKRICVLSLTYNSVWSLCRVFSLGRTIWQVYFWFLFVFFFTSCQAWLL